MMYHSRDLSDTKSMAPQADKGPKNISVAFVRLAAEDLCCFWLGWEGCCAFGKSEQMVWICSKYQGRALQEFLMFQE